MDCTRSCRHHFSSIVTLILYMIFIRRILRPRGAAHPKGPRLQLEAQEFGATAQGPRRNSARGKRGIKNGDLCPRLRDLAASAGSNRSCKNRDCVSKPRWSPGQHPCELQPRLRLSWSRRLLTRDPRTCSARLPWGQGPRPPSPWRGRACPRRLSKSFASSLLVSSGRPPGRAPRRLG